MSVKAKIMSKKWVQKIVGGAMALTMAVSIAAPAAAPVSAGPITRNVIGASAAVAHATAHVLTVANLTKSTFDLPVDLLLGGGLPFTPGWFRGTFDSLSYLSLLGIRALTIPPMVHAVIWNGVDLALLGAGTLGAGAAALGTAAVATPVVLFVANTPLRVARHATEAAVLGTGAALIAIPVVGTAALGTGAALLAVPVIGAGALGAGALGLGALGVGTLGALGLGAAALGTTAVVGTGAAAAGVAGLIALNALNNNDEEEPTDETTPTDTTKEASDKTSTDTDYNANDQSYLEQAVHAIHDSIFGSSDETSTASENQLPAENTEATLEEAPAQA